jgi:PIN domain nuclease of toxin-antitoxin system
MKILMDTHVWYWFVMGDKTLPAKVIELINRAALDDYLYLSDISVLELAMMEGKGRINFQLPTLQWIEKALKGVPVQLISLHPAIAVESCQLEGFHGDPADRIIVATARVENLTLLTRDKKIQSYAKHNKVKIVLV